MGALNLTVALGVLVGLLAGCPSDVSAGEPQPGLEVYGAVQLDYIQDFRRVDPDWEATLRPSKIPTTPGQFGSDGQSILSVRQTRLGVKANAPVGSHDLTSQFEFDLFGVGDNAGETTFRLRHAWASWGPLLVGQTNSLFMDADLFPNVVDYWGPNGMVFVRNPQVRLTLLDQAGFEFAMAIEKASTDIDPGNIREIDPNLGNNIQDVTPLPDLTMRARYVADWGHIQVSGMLAKLAYETRGTPDNQPRDSLLGAGVNLGTSLNLTSSTTLRTGIVYGHGIASYMNDGGTDVAPQTTSNAPGLEAVAVPLLGVIAYIDHRWSKELTTAFGYSFSKVDNTDFQSGSAYRKGEYASANLLWEPSPGFLIGGEVLYGKLTDNSGATGDDIRTQLTFKANFSSNDFIKRE